jgi:hypothetical protein
MAYDIAEITKESGTVACTAPGQPFVPAFPPGAPRLAVDVTGLDPMPGPGWLWLGGRDFAPPPEGGPPPPDQGGGEGAGGEAEGGEA